MSKPVPTRNTNYLPSKFHCRGQKKLRDMLILGDNKLDRRALLLQISSGLPANVSSGTVLGYQFSEDTVFKSAVLHECPVQIASRPLEVEYTAVDQCKLLEIFPGIPDHYPENTIHILPFNISTKLTCISK